MNCIFVVDTCIRGSENSQNYKVVMKNFLRQLYDAKESQVEEERKKWLEVIGKPEEKHQANNEKSDPSYVKEVLNPVKREMPELLKPKNRSLMNPNQKKRKAQGIKFECGI